MSIVIKTCKKCSKELPDDRFYPLDKDRKYYSGKCKDCTKDDVRKNRLDNVEYYREYDRNRGNRQHPEYGKEYRTIYPKKYKAQTMVGNAVRDGRLEKKEECELCGEAGKLHGHHDDYLKPLDVRWLCAACHRQWHVEHGEAENAL